MRLLEKIAISPELRQKAFIERGARNLAIKPNMVNEQVGLNMRNTPSSSWMPEFDNVTRNAVQLKGPANQAYVQRGLKSFDQPTLEKIKTRATDIRNAAVQGLPISQGTPMGVGSKPGLLNKATSFLKSPVGKGVGIGAGVLGAGLLANKLMSSPQQQPMQKMAFSPAAISGLELGGLGILAKPGIDTLRDPNASAHDKSHAKWETAGLGVLGLHPAYELGQAAKPHISNALSKVQPALSSAAGTALGESAGLASNIGNKISPLLSKIKLH